MADIIQIDQLKIERTRRGFCAHKRLVYDSENEHIECSDCGLPVQPFKAFMILVGNYNASVADIQHRQQELAELEELCSRNVLKSVKEIDRIWRGNMLPCCPHCNTAIAPDDGLGRSRVNKKMEMERRRFAKATAKRK